MQGNPRPAVELAHENFGEIRSRKGLELALHVKPERLALDKTASLSNEFDRVMRRQKAVS
jgi:hypothetical protein